MRGKFIIISAPSGTGKNAIIRDLLKIFTNSKRLVTTTTREPRPNEKNGIDYHFVTETEFERMVQNNEFLEHNNYVGNWYGSERKKLEKDLAENEFVFSTLDVNGKKSLDSMGFSHISIFLLPDNLDQLDDRIRARGGESEKDIERRVETAHGEMNEVSRYDFRVINKEGKMQETVAQIAAFLMSEQVN